MIAAIKAFPPATILIKSVISMFALALSVYIYNDLSDIDLDKISAKAGQSHYVNRPLVSGKASTLDAKIFVLAMASISLGIGLSVNLTFFLLLTVFSVLGILYSTRPANLKNRFILKQLVISFGQAIATLAGGAAVGAMPSQVIYASALFFALGFCASPLVDIRDMCFDEKMGRKTFPVVIGSKATAKFTGISIVVILVASVISYSWVGFNFAFVLLFSASLLVLLLSTIRIYNNLDDPNFIEGIAKRTLRPLFLILQISFLIGLLSLP